MNKNERLRVVRQLNSFYGVSLVALSALVLRLMQLQVVEGQTWKTKAASVRIDQWELPSPRGDIYDRNHKLMVTSQASYSLYFTPLGLKQTEYKTFAERTAKWIGQPVETVLRKMDVVPPQHAPASEPRCLIRGLTDKQIAVLSENRADLPGMQVVTEPKRYYVNGSLGCHILGYLNSIPQESFKKYRELGYRPDARVGVFGVEKSYESFLKGKNGIVNVRVNRLNQIVRSETIQNPIKGHDVVLTIDSRLQQATEQALSDQIAKINSNPKLKHVSNAMAVAMNPETGEVLAMASYPGFDPNWWVNGIDDSTYQKFFAPAEMNRVIQQPIAPGSTIKPATVLLGLEKGIISPYTRFYDAGRLQVGWVEGKPHYLYCWDHHGHGSVNARQALAMSCNVYMYQLSLAMGGWSNYLLHVNDWVNFRLPRIASSFDQYYSQFGLGKPTGIDLEEEDTGYMAKARYLADLPFIAIGQHESYTAIELVQYVSVLANGGKRVQPHVVKEIRAQNNHIVAEKGVKILNTVHLPRGYLKVVQEGMQDVIRANYGTAYSSFVGAPYTAAGKTGTAETGVGEDNALFIGYAPAEHPRIAITVIVPGGGHGADSSVPIARRIFDSYFSRT